MGTKSTNIKCVQRQKSRLHTHSVCTKTTNDTKIEYKKLPPISQIVIWLLAFCVLAAFSLCPLAGLAMQRNITAGGPSDNTFYINAPVFVAGDTECSETTGSADASTGVLNDSAKDKALFKTGGEIDAKVLADLLNMLDDSKVTENPITDNINSGVKYYSAKNFGKYGTQKNWTSDQKGNAQILVKLFETTTDSNDENKINEATAQYWQAVYRSINGKNDVLTLYMTNPYKDAVFDNKYANYSKSAIRTTITNDYTTLSNKFINLDKYVVAPYQLSQINASDITTKTTNLTGYDSNKFLDLGGWQSSAYQTSNRAPNRTETPSINDNWLLGVKLGASGYCDGNDTSRGCEYGVNNGLDGLGDGWKSWTSIDSNYTDKLWLPSGFEVLHTGYDPNNSANTSRNGSNGIYDGNNDIICLNGDYDKASAGINTSALTTSHTNENRTGLWELNGYDRANNSWAWLRSGLSNFASGVRGVDWGGINRSDSVHRLYGVRPALHLNLGVLKSLVTTNLQIMATNNAPNSLLILTIMDGSTQVAVYSCISGTISANLSLTQNKTYKILATRPFGSRLTVNLDSVLLFPTNFGYYEIFTDTKSLINMAFILSNTSSSNNYIVI